MRRSHDDFLSPETIFFSLIKDYEQGRLTSNRFLYRAVVVDVDREGGQLESMPPNPPGSIRARVYTYGIDATMPEIALTIFHPFFPMNIAPPVEVDEHVYVMFEDEQYSNGLWITTVPHLRDLNFLDPEEQRQTGEPTAANAFEGTSPDSYSINRDDEFGGGSEEDSQREETINVFRENETSILQGKRILHIGDSQVAGPFGLEFGQLVLEANAASYDRVGRQNWGVSAWVDSRLTPTSRVEDSLQRLINRHNPNLIIITLGGNDYQSAQRDLSAYQRKISRLYSIARGDSNRMVFWISPPKAVGPSAYQQPRRDRVSEAIHSVVGANFIESRDITGQAGRSRDGIHFTRRGGREWAAAIIRRIMNTL